MRLHAKASPSTETTGGLSATLIAWGEAGRPHDDTGRSYDVVIEAGGLVATDGDVLAFDGHRVDGTGDIIGAVRDYTTDADGFHVDIETWSLTAADRVRELGRHLPLSVSAEFTGDNAPGDDGAIRFTADNPATLTGVAVLDPLAAGAFPSARVTKVASLKEKDMTETIAADIEATAPSDGKELALVAELRAEMAEEIRRGLAAASGSGRSTAPHPLAQFASFTDLQHAALTADGGAEISATFAAGYRQHRDLQAQRAYYGLFVDQITTDNPGVVPPSYLTNVYGLIDTGRRVVNAIGGPTSAGDSGMVVNWPYYDGDLSAIVAEQLTEKSDINSVKVSLKKGQADLATYAGGSDVSYQLIRRSSPAYLSIYERILTAAYNVTTDSVLADTLVADGTGYVPFTPASATGEQAAKAAIAASVKVDTATGSPASTIIAGTNAFASLAVAFWSHAPAYGTQNTGGTSQASTLQVNVSGLSVVHAPTMDTNTAVVTNSSAAGWLEDGPFLVTAEDVEKLGRDVAIWGMGAPAVFVPAGVVILAATAPVADTASTSKKK